MNAADGQIVAATALDAQSPTCQTLLLDAGLCALLSRMAALQGRAMPAHRFGMVEQTVDGIALSDLGRPDRAAAMWLAAFPNGRIVRASRVRAHVASGSLVWFSGDGTDARLIRGSVSGGRWVAEDVGGTHVELRGEELAAGITLELIVHADAEPQHEVPQPRGTALAWFWHAILLRRRVFIEAVVATALVSVIGLASSLYSMQVYDRVVPTQGYSTLWVLTVGVLVAICLELVVKQVRAVMVDRVCKVIDQQLSGLFFDRAMAIRMEARPNTVGTFAAQIRQFETVRNFMTSSTLFILADLPFALVFVVVIAAIAGNLALIPLAFLFVSVVTALMFRGTLERLTGAHMLESNQKNGLLIESIDGVESVKAASGEWKMLDRWQRLTATVAEGELQIRSLAVLASNLTQALQQLSYVGLVAGGVHAIGAGSMTMGGLIACTIISGRALTPFAQISGFIVQWQMAKAALKGLDQLVELPTDGPIDGRPLIPDHCAGELTLTEVKFSYRDGRTGFVAPSLQFKPGERVAVLGAVGSGKSTLIKVLSGLFRPGEGRVLLDGTDIALLAPEFVREHVGYLPQDVRLFQGSVRDNLTMGLASPSDSQVLAAARLTGLDASVGANPKGFGLEIAEGGRGLSGGQRQLVGLTRLLIARPRILLLDEPTASMDGEMEVRVMRAILGALDPQGLAVVVTHKTAVLQYVSRVIVMDRGRIVMDGPRDAVLSALKSAATQGQAAAAARSGDVVVQVQAQANQGGSQ